MKQKNFAPGVDISKGYYLNVLISARELNFQLSLIIFK